MNLDPNVAVGVATAFVAIVTAIGSAVAVVFYGGRQVGKVEAAISRLTNIEESLKDVGILNTDVKILQEMYVRIRSDFKALRDKVDTQTVSVAEVRSKLESQHNE